jgi:tRNA pseudouridine38-40 synthase
MRCTLSRSEWVFGEDEMTYHIAANRFLRGMVRLIVGMCLRVGEGRLTLAEVHDALERQQRLPKPWSAPAAGLFLCKVDYSGRTHWRSYP